MSKYEVFTNSVGKEASRVIHLKVLKAVSEIVMQTAGPKGSTTMIMQNGKYPIYSKDGKKVVDNVKVFGEIEQGILDQLLQITENVVKRVGDGTTSAIRLAYLIFNELVKLERDNKLGMNTYDIVDGFKDTVKCISDEIIKNGKEFSADDAYDICMVSTNGNEELSTIIADIYKKYGKNVYIDLKSSNNSGYMIKEYEGLTISKGFASPAYINRTGEICNIRNAKIYVFKDPVDTPEMIGFFTRIIYDNIITPFENLRKINDLKNNPQKAKSYTMQQLTDLESGCTMTPTVIMCPFISRDLSAELEALESLLYSFDKNESLRAQKPPIAIVNNLSRYIDELSDISMLCGCKVISKYIDESVQAIDIESGKAPTIDTITNFCGFAEEVVIDNEKTRFINPLNMFKRDDNGEIIKDEDGKLINSDTFDSIVSFLKGQLEEAKRLQEDVVEINRLKRRLSGLTAGLVELYIGGISITDRESIKDLADDAVRNCRSASLNGVGRAANFEGLFASKKIRVYDLDEKHRMFAEIIENAYTEVIKNLYSTCMPSNTVDEEFEKSVKYGKPLNLRTLIYQNNVLTSIDTDIAILDCIARIVTIMFTSNQILIKDPFNNTYASIGEDE